MWVGAFAAYRVLAFMPQAATPLCGHYLSTWTLLIEPMQSAMDLSVTNRSRLELLKRQYLQLLDPKELVWPPRELLRCIHVQSWIFEHLFDQSISKFLPPERYRSRVLKRLLELIESSIEDPDQDVGHYLEQLHNGQLYIALSNLPLRARTLSPP